jgi:hypothetical protein
MGYITILDRFFFFFLDFMSLFVLFWDGAKYIYFLAQ